MTKYIEDERFLFDEEIVFFFCVIITAEKHRPSGLTGTGNPLEKIPAVAFPPFDFLVCRSGHTGTAIRSG